jgi:hypothetical protein
MFCFRVLGIIVVPIEECLGNSYVRVALSSDGGLEINNTEIAQLAAASGRLRYGFATGRSIECTTQTGSCLSYKARAFSPTVEICPLDRIVV